MNMRLRFFLIAAILIYFFSVVSLLKMQKLQLKYTLMRGTAGLMMFFMIIFPDKTIRMIHLIGIIDTKLDMQYIPKTYGAYGNNN